MANQKLETTLALLAALDLRPQSAPALAERLGVSVPTVARLVAELRGLGCEIEALREGHSDWGYHLHDWGVFEPARVRRYVEQKQGKAMTTGFEIYDRFSHLNGTDAGNAALEEYQAAIDSGKDEIEAEILASNVLQRAGFNVNSKGGVSIRAVVR